MPKLSEVISVNNDFKNAINLYLDLNNIEKISSYIPTKSSIDILSQYLNAVEENKQQATLLVGPYGKGKSHLLLLLVAILSLRRTKENKEVIRELVKKVKTTDRDTAVKINNIFENKDPFLPVIISSTQGDLNQAFMVGLFEALKREGLTNLKPDTYFSYAIESIKRWKNNFPETYQSYVAEVKKKKIAPKEMMVGLSNCESEKLELFKEIYPSLTSGETFNPLVNSEVLPMYKNISDKLREEYGYSGIYIIFDEFSKYIEGQDKKSSGNNMKLLQDICELSNSSKESQIFLTMVAHKSIKEYGKYLSIDTINSFTGIEGRIKEILFVTSSKNNYELIKNAIHKNEKLMSNEIRIRKQIQEGKESFQKLVAFSAVFTKNDFEEIVVKGCYPLSPISAYLLLNISEKVAQNERTLFTFVSKDEQYSMINYIKEMSENMPWIINSDLIYDYFKELFKKDITNELVHNEWLNAEYALTQVNDSNLKKLIKTLAIINIVNKPDELPANIDHLRLAFGSSDVENEIKKLEQKGLIYKKSSNGCYVFKTRATSEIRTEIKKRKELKGNRVNIGKVLSRISEVKYVLPRKYNKQYCMTRYFVYEYMDVKDFLSLHDLQILLEDGNFFDGKIIALYNLEDQDFSEKIKKHLNKGCPPNLIVVYGHKTLNIYSQICEFDMVQDLKGDELFFSVNENKVLKKEIPVIEEDLEKEISAYIDSAFGEFAKKTIVYTNKGNIIQDNASSLADIADKICFDMYNKSTIVNNELINKEFIKTSPIKKVRKNLIEILLKHEDTEPFMRGTSADATIYRALFVGTGIRSGKLGKNVKNMLNVFKKFIDSAADKKVLMKKLMDELTLAPIGMRSGIIPIYFAYTISLRKEEIVVYFGDKEVEITPDMILNMCDNPDDYSIYVSLDDMKKERYVQDLCNLFYVTDTARYTDSKIGSILTGMQRWFRSLPQVTKNIRNQSEYFMDVTIEAAFPQFKRLLQTVDANPYEVLFVDLPALFETEDDYVTLIEKITLLKNKLNGYYEWLKEKTVEAVIIVFGNKRSLGLKHTLLEWYDKQSDIAKHGLQSKKVTNLMSCIADNNTYDDYALVEKIVKSVTEVYMDSWNDTSLNNFLAELESVKSEAESMDTTMTNVGKCELSFISKSGEQITRFYEPVSEGTGAILRTILADNLEDFSDLSVNDKIAILLEMIEKELG